MAQLHHSDAGLSGGTPATFTAQTTRMHTVSTNAPQVPVNGKLPWTGGSYPHLSLQTAAGVIVYIADGGAAAQVPLVSGTSYKWVISGVPNNALIVDVNDGL